MTADLVYALVGGVLVLAVVLPVALRRHAVSAPLVLLFVGALAGLLPLPGGLASTLPQERAFIEHLTEFTVLVALMGVGLALDRPLDLRHWQAWRSWGATWRLLAVTMPLTIAAVAGLGWWFLALSPAAALLLGAVLAPTDPVLASDVQVEGPTPLEEQGETEIDEDDEVRFAITSEAGLNDGLAFPFVYAAIFLVTMGSAEDWVLRWLGWELAGKTVVGVLVGVAVGWLLARLAFRAPSPTLRLAETGEPLLALAGVLLSYGLAEAAQGYGFLAVFACAMTLRSAERGHDYHVHMHQTVERLERLLTLVVLLLLGVALTNGLLEALTWQGAVTGLLLVLVVRPLAGWVALRLGSGTDRVGEHTLGPKERLATAFFGVRGVGSVYYLAYATGQAGFDQEGLLWSVVGFTITLSVLMHGVAATPVMRWLDRVRHDESAGRDADLRGSDS